MRHAASRLRLLHAASRQMTIRAALRSLLLLLDTRLEKNSHTTIVNHIKGTDKVNENISDG